MLLPSVLLKTFKNKLCKRVENDEKNKKRIYNG